MNFHSILAITNLSTQGDRAVVRAAMLAAQRRALLKIMYAPSHAEDSVRTGVEQDMRRLAAQMYTRFDILVKNVAETGGHLDALAEEARWADMLVVGEQWNQPSRPFSFGRPIERLQRIVHCPILLARLEVVERYRRVLVAIDSVPDSSTLLKLARSLDRDAEVEPFYPLLRASDAPSARPSRVAAIPGRGDAARQAVIQEQHSNADLIVVGKGRRYGLSDFFFGRMAHRVLRLTSRDVLLVPHDLGLDPKAETTKSSRSLRGATIVHPARSIGG